MATYTAKQHEVLEIIRQSLEERGIAPTLEEIAEALGGTSRVTALAHLRALEKKGAIRRRARESRAIEMLDVRYRPARGVPLLGSIAAGEPILEAEVREDIRIEEYLGAQEGTFLLRVEGDSMIEDQIRDGDLVLVESRSSARDGEVVVAVVGGEVTLKRLFREKARIRLQPANATLSPKTYASDEIEVRGVVKGVIRRV
ncbi:MAG: transcriptional repressor LexA [Planctomycetaceae bacterium]